ncbi:hypothetical protein [Paenibacillus crassostreae]|uniref:Copper amine oxidase-like N-terminal domain-containing protein n=1 Tax=Paenibacillus crassostreae TaxID=1763538 RepID=A0A162KVY6_9BACL|nr:hypothetical protein [Paenibacillus crassostreae]AOZ91015.1 hypothetical protein LPB68_01550 [Paenibacillus crassostreae]OAB74823.1 hypothetical protein PNBC_12405 [Paenibacillus crassostreae]
MRKSFKKSLTVTLLVTLMSMMFALEVGADDTKVSGALTTPPPKEEIKVTEINPSFVYLFDGISTITDQGNLKVRVNATTVAYETVSSLGADVSIQRWTGKDWITIKSTVLSTTLSDNFTGKADWDVTKGYYYRGMSNHWIKKGDIKEQFVTYTSSILITK